MENELTRRQFLKRGGVVVGTALLPNLVSAHMKSNANIALQLWTVRDAFEKDIPGTLQRLREIGFQYVETAFWPKSVSLKQAGKMISDAGLKVAACHVELPIEAGKDAMLETAEVFGCKRMIWHGWPEDKRYSSYDGTMELINVYNQSSEFAKSHGLELGLHNHWWEFQHRLADHYVYDWLLQGVSPEVFFEIDTYWVNVAGQDPAAAISKFGDRVKYLHMKDGPARWTPSLVKDEPEPNSVLGSGNMNMPAIFNALNPNIEFLVIEMDRVEGDVMKAVEASYKYLQKKIK